ncbi:TonB-dependent receptor plug domain-containing protein [Parahaliea sp. F7430]|uniref:TonB-dependent receptor plug domain-containing protein n=1 Tax=Sediminihaliea albiluteola TaxID=2758564 RepID=A0A7W2TU82_9GAMM|nr:TonB-dependent receptor [Sediminihaliea albiluteola]MBA6411973.1 TonB-dependent receptor plug domain-containing protein [Sediminihaliea albiluteola]
MQKSCFNPRPLAMAISLLAIPAAPMTMAQGHALEEVVVTAQKREESSQETPISITALSTTDLENRGIENSEDLIGQIAGMSGYDAPGQRAAVSLNMRGVSGGAPNNISLDPAVGIYIDGVFVGKQAGSAMDVAELERIEVLRGPQGTLYGRNSTGGAVNFITRKPTGEFGLRATASVGNYDYRQFKVNMDLPSVGQVGEGLGELAVNFGYQTRLRDGLYKNKSPGGDDFDEMDRQAWRFAAQLNVTDNFVVDYAYDNSKLDEVNAMQQVVGLNPLDAAGNVSMLDGLRGTLGAAQGWAQIPAADPRISERWIPSLQQTISGLEQAQARGQGRASSGMADFTPLSKNDSDGHALTLTFDAGDMGALGDVTFRGIAAQRELETFVYGDIENIDSSLDSNGVGAMNSLVHSTLGQIYGAAYELGIPTEFLPIDALWDGIDNLGAYHTNQNTSTEYEQKSLELQMIGTTETVDYVLGYYRFWDEGAFERDAVFAAPLGGVVDESYYSDTYAWATFTQATWTPGWFDNRLALTAGLRYTEEKKRIDYDYGEVVSPFGVTPARAVSRSKDFSNTSGNFTVAFQATDELNTYLRYATGYRSGGFNGEQYDNTYDEETIEQLELGFKSDWWDRRLRINGAIYGYKYDDLQVSQVKTDDGTATTLLTNAGSAERWGGELEILAAPIEDLIVGFSYAYINGDFEKYPDVCGTGEFQDTCINGSKNAHRSSPGNQVGASLDYVFARTNFGDFTGYLQVNWQDAYPENSLWSGNINGEPVIYDKQGMDERTVVNARLSLQDIPAGDGMFKVTLWGKNLLDDDYPTFAINLGALGLITEQYAPPRTYGLELSYEY